jgi:hypothetical protein
MLPWVLMGSIVLHRIHELRWSRTGEDRQEQYRGEPMTLILRGECARVPGPEVGGQEQDVVRPEHRLLLRRRVQSEFVFQQEDILQWR